MPTPVEFVLKSIRASKNDKATGINLTKEKLKSSCGTCCKNVLHNQNSLAFSKCLHCIHIKWSGISLSEYDKIIQEREPNPGNIENELRNCPECNILQNVKFNENSRNDS